eukprot:6976145-Alexandrium_andersonii.AAC.1
MRNHEQVGRRRSGVPSEALAAEVESGAVECLIADGGGSCGCQVAAGTAPPDNPGDVAVGELAGGSMDEEICK